MKTPALLYVREGLCGLEAKSCPEELNLDQGGQEVAVYRFLHTRKVTRAVIVGEVVRDTLLLGQKGGPE